MSAAEKVAFGGWPNCYRLSNGQIELIVTTDVGPRVARLGFVGQANLFAEFKEQQGKTVGDDWRIYGGHRLWHAPEDTVRTYEPDNRPVKLAQIEGGVRLTQLVEKTTGIEKEIEITLDSGANHVHLVHRLRNHNLWAVESGALVDFRDGHQRRGHHPAAAARPPRGQPAARQHAEHVGLHQHGRSALDVGP